MNKNKERFGLFTTISMIIGIVIGSGIFFKTPYILANTNGSVLLGVLVFIFASMAIIFGSLTLAQLAFRTKEGGGIINYAKMCYGKTAAGMFGWFLSFVYFPTIRCVVAWVSAIYLLMFLGISASLEIQILLALAIILFLTAINILSAKGSGWLQSGAMVIKLIPLFFIAIVGFFFNQDPVSSAAGMNNISSASFLPFLAAIGPVSFIFDGWTIATTVSGEIKNPRKTLPLALAIAPIFILFIYVAYFVAVTRLMNVSDIIAADSSYIEVILNNLLGNVGYKILLFTLVVSMIGTTNGLTLGDSRSLNYIATLDLVFASDKLKVESKKQHIPINSLIVTTIVAIFWLLVHYLTTKFSLLGSSDVSEIAIATLYLFLILLYVKVIVLKKKGEITGFIKGYLFPILAIIGAIIIFSGAFVNPLFIFYLLFSVIVVFTAYLYLNKKTKSAEDN